ncbi:MAG: hypothetical protein ACTHJM_15580 [Marmoricola sp.]
MIDVKLLANRWFIWAFCLVVAAGLGVDAYVHLHDASSYAMVKTSFISQATLFRIEGIAAIVAAVLLLVRPHWITALLALLVGGGGVAAVLLYTETDPGKIGPLPDMYEPVWFTDKTNSLIGEAVAAGVALLVLVMLLASRRLSRSSRQEVAS